jgi:predicted nucleic acid-binding protein
MPLLVDTGALYALADADDAWHRRMRDFLAGERQALLTPSTVIPEAAYLIRSRLGPRIEKMFVESLAAGEITVENLTQADLARCAQLLGEYDFLGLVDASLVAVAERLKLKALVTTDRRDFRRVRPKHIPAFDLLP